MQLTSDQRALQSKNDDLGAKLRNCERERNDLRTRLAAELRNYQVSREELLNRQKGLE